MKILLAIDDSRHSQAALQSIIARGSSPGTEVRVLHVLEPPSAMLGPEMTGYDPEFETVWRALQEHGKSLVMKAGDVLRNAGFNVSTVLEEGNPKSQIIDVANQWRPDLIVLGSHGRKGMSRFLMGSVSEAIVRHAHCSVEIVRVRE
jgi:nucleotide-binding universal stress UspA family protein